MEITVLGLTTVYFFLLFSSLIVLILFMCNFDSKKTGLFLFQDRIHHKEMSVFALGAKDKVTKEAVSECCYSFVIENAKPVSENTRLAAMTKRSVKERWKKNPVWEEQHGNVRTVYCPFIPTHTPLFIANVLQVGHYTTVFLCLYGGGGNTLPVFIAASDKYSWFSATAGRMRPFWR